MTVTDAVADIKRRIIPGVRGAGCFAIDMVDGREYVLVSEYGEPLVERFSAGGQLIERLPADEVEGDVTEIRCRVDELGGIVF